MTPDELNRLVGIERESQRQHSQTIAVCTSAGCLPLHSQQVKEALETEVQRCGRGAECKVKGVGCLGLCSAGPLVAVHPGDVLYQKVSVDNAPAIVQHLDGAAFERLQCRTDQPFFARQHKIVLENCGRIDPERMEEYLLRDGYRALLSVLTQMTPAQVIEQITRSGLRGRGGAGYPTGLKWATVAKAHPGAGRA